LNNKTTIWLTTLNTLRKETQLKKRVERLFP
jgi:hypothetical protein